jgi:hypothetical protein
MRLARTTSSLVVWTLALALTGGLAACSDSSDDESGQTEAAGASNDDAADDDAADDDAADDTLTVAVSADEGGTVADEAGTAALVIPAGALATDQDITLAVSAASNGAETNVYDFGPDGLSFEAPVTLSIDYDGEVPDGMKAVLAVEENGEWVEIDGSSASAGVVSGEITHFSAFTVILVNGEIVLTSACADRLDGFTPCGGDLQGAWTLHEFCFPPIDAGSSDSGFQCSGMYVDVDYQVSGTITFTADTVTVGEQQSSMSSMLNVPVSCLTSSGATCDMLADDTTSCAVSGDLCQCSEPASTNTDPAGEPENYSVDGNELTVEESDGAKTYPFCITGDELEVLVDSEGSDGTITQILQVLTRQ